MTKVFTFLMLVILVVLTSITNGNSAERRQQYQQQHNYAPQQRVAPQQYRPQAQLRQPQYAVPQQRGVQQRQQYATQPQVQHYGSQFLSQTRPQYAGQPRQMYQVPQYYRQNVGRPQGVPQQWGAPQQNQSQSNSSSSSPLSGIGSALSGLLGGDNDKSQSGQTTVIVQQPVIAWAPPPLAQGIAFVSPVAPRPAPQSYEVTTVPSTVVQPNASNEALTPAPVAQATPVDANPAILAMQKMLHEQGLYEGPVDGTMNDQTARGLVLYQAVMQSTARMTPDEAAAADAAVPEEKTAAELNAPVSAPATPVASVPAQQAQSVATPAETPAKVKTSVPEVKAEEPEVQTTAPAATQEAAAEEHILRIPKHHTTTDSANAEPPVPNAAPQDNVTTDKLDRVTPHSLAPQRKSITSKTGFDA